MGFLDKFKNKKAVEAAVPVENQENPEKKVKKSVYVEITAEEKGISYEEAQELMNRIKAEYGITYKEFANNKLFTFETEDALVKKIQRLEKQNKNYIQNVCNDTGWTFEEAEAAAKEAKAKYGFNYRTFSTYQFFSRTEEEIQAKRQEWKDSFRKYRDIVQENTGWPIHDVIKHMRRYQILYNIIPAYYVLYKAWELDDEKMDSYARQEISRHLWTKYNEKEETKILADKLQFDQVYSDFIGRKFWVNVDTTFEEFEKFTEGLDDIFCKPVISGGGIGTRKIKVDHDKGKLKELYDEFMSIDRVLVEECVKQHPEMNEFIPGCVNTVRVVVLLKDDVCNVICTGVRFGYDGITDNFSKDGMVCDVDKETGVIITPAIDKKGHIYEEHPISHKKFVGFQIPHWDLVLETAEKAIRVQDGINYVGWDLAICEDKVVIIEGNSMPDLVLIQAPYAPKKEGKKYLFEPYM